MNHVPFSSPTFTFGGEEYAYAPPEGHGLNGPGADIISRYPGKYVAYIQSLFLAFGGNSSNPQQMALLNLLINAAPTLPSSGENEARAMDSMARTSFGYGEEYVPRDNGNLNRVLRAPTHNEIQGLIDKINCACNL